MLTQEMIDHYNWFRGEDVILRMIMWTPLLAFLMQKPICNAKILQWSVVTKQQVERFAQKWESGMYDWEPDIWNLLNTAVDLEPRIEVSDDYCIIEWVEIESEYGMFRRKYRVSRTRYMIECLSEIALASVTATWHPL